MGPLTMMFIFWREKRERIKIGGEVWDDTFSTTSAAEEQVELDVTEVQGQVIVS